MPVDGSKFTPAEVGVFAVCELIAVPLCHAGWEAVVTHEHFSQGLVALVIGLPLGVLGIGFHWWREKISTASGEWITSQAKRWWPVALAGAFIYVAGPSIYQRATAPSVDPLPDTGRITWNFEQTAKNAGYFLNMVKVNNQAIRIVSFGAHGKNTSADPISRLTGYLRSDLTNGELPLYVLAQDADLPKEKNVCLINSWIPTLPLETFGIPPFADFDVVTHKKTAIEPDIDGVPVVDFINGFGPFTIVLEYDGKTFTRHFSKDEIQKQVELFEKSTNLQSIPHVLRRANAAVPVTPKLRPLISTPAPPPMATPVPNFKTLIPPSNEDTTSSIPQSPKN